MGQTIMVEQTIWQFGQWVMGRLEFELFHQGLAIDRNCR